MSGTLCLVASTVFFTLMGSTIKLVAEVPFYEVVFCRSLVSAILCIFFLKRQSISLIGNDKNRLLFRGLTGTGSLTLYFLTLQKMPFAIAVTLQYLSPIFTIIISSILLREMPTCLQVTGVIVSFISVSFMHGVGMSSMSLYSLLGIAAAFLAALSYTSIMSLNKTEHPLVIVFYFAWVTLACVTPWTITHWKTLNPRECVLLLIMSLAAQFAQYFLTLAYQKEKAAKIAPLTYLNVVWAVILSKFVWGEDLSHKAIFCIFLIIFCAVLANIPGFRNLRNRTLVRTKGCL